MIKVLLIFLITTSTCFADNPMFRRHVYERLDGRCVVKEWFVDEKGNVIHGDGDSDAGLYKPVVKTNKEPFCREIDKPDKYLNTI